MQGIGNFATKLVAMAKSLEESEKLDRIEKIHANTFHLVKKIVKIGPVDTEIAFLILKKEKITEGKIYSPVGNFAERAKLVLRGSSQAAMIERGEMLASQTALQSSTYCTV